MERGPWPRKACRYCHSKEPGLPLLGQHWALPRVSPASGHPVGPQLVHALDATGEGGRPSAQPCPGLPGPSAVQGVGLSPLPGSQQRGRPLGRRPPHPVPEGAGVQGHAGDTGTRETPSSLPWGMRNVPIGLWRVLGQAEGGGQSRGISPPCRPSTVTPTRTLSARPCRCPSPAQCL